MHRELRRSPAVLMVVLLLAALLALVAPTAAPPAQAGESGAAVQGNFVPLTKPARVLTKTFTATTAAENSVSFTALGVQGIPRTGTTALVLVASLKTTDPHSYLWLCSVFLSDGSCRQNYVSQTDGTVGNVSGMLTMPVDASKTTNQVRLRTTNKAATVTVDVAGYYTSTATGGGFVPTRQTSLVDTRKAPEVMVPAGGVITRKLTGGIIPEGSTAAYLNVAAGSITAAGTIIAVPAPVDPATAYPVMTFWGTAGTRTELAVVKLPADGRVTFKNTSTKPVHLMVRAQGYTTSSPATGADYQPITNHNSLGTNETVPPGGKMDLPVAGLALWMIPLHGTAAVPLKLSVWPVPYNATPVSGYIRVTPKDQALPSTSALTFNASMGGFREASAVLVPGHKVSQSTRWVTVENVSTISVSVAVDIHGYFLGPQNYATAGGDPMVGVARTSAGPCYGYLDPANQGITAGCADDYDQAGLETVWSPIGALGEKFRGPVAVASRPGGRFAVAAVHATDGELWTWEFPHGAGALPDTPPIRSFRRVKSNVVAANLPDGKPVGFVADVQGRWWAIDLDVTAPEQPHWKQLDVPPAAVAPVGELTAVTTPAGIQLAGRTASGDVVTGTYAPGVTSLGWQSLGAVDVVSKVGLGVAQSGEIRLAVRRADSSVWSARLDPASGVTVDGWHQVGVPDPAVAPVGTPSVVYDPQTLRNGVLVRSGATSTGALYRVWESTPGSGDFSGPFTGVSLESSGVASDLTTWDYRTEEPLYRRWSFLYLDGSLSRRLGTSYAS